jgi:DNA repair protein RadD
MTAQSLRPYQLDALSQAREAYRQGKRAPVVVLPTGGGKTTIGSAFCRKALATGKTVLWVAHRDELLVQARDRLLADGHGRVGIISPEHATINAPCQVASICTLVARAERGLPPGDVVIYDEGHHAGAKGWLEVMRALRAKSQVMLGLTATPERGDGAPLGDLFDAMVQVSSVRELQSLGFLVPCRTYSPAKHQKALSMDPVAAHLSRSPGQRTVVFARDVAHAEAVTMAFLAAGVPAACLHAGTKPLLREGRLLAFKSQSRDPLLARGYSGEKVPLVLVNAFILTEGIDVPEIAHVILARGCGHPGMMLQMVGRALRPAPGKELAIFSDLRGVTRRRSIGLPEADRRWSLDGKANGAQEEHETERPLVSCPACEATVSGWTTDREGWRICPHCRERISAPEPVKVEQRRQHVFGATADEARKREALEKLAREAAKRGRKPGWAAYRFAELFACPPPWGAARAAVAQAIADQGFDPRAEEEAERAAIQGEAEGRPLN